MFLSSPISHSFTSFGELGLTIEVCESFQLYAWIKTDFDFASAWKSSQYLNSLISTAQIELVSSHQLESVYSGTSTSTPSKDGELLLTLDKVPKIGQAFKLSEDETAELRRAVVQADDRMKAELAKEKVEEGDQGKKTE